MKGQRRREEQKGFLFQDRKLNSCEVCGTKKQLAMTSWPGRLVFLCFGHHTLDQALMRTLEVKEPPR